MRLDVLHTAGTDTWLDAGQWDIVAGALVLYHVQTKRILAAYGPHQWITARWAHSDGTEP